MLLAEKVVVYGRVSLQERIALRRQEQLTISVGSLFQQGLSALAFASPCYKRTQKVFKEAQIDNELVPDS